MEKKTSNLAFTLLIPILLYLVLSYGNWELGLPTVFNFDNQTIFLSFIYKTLTSLALFLLITGLITPLTLIRQEYIVKVNSKFGENIVLEGVWAWGNGKWLKIASAYQFLIFYLYGYVFYKSQAFSLSFDNPLLISIFKLLTFRANPIAYLVLLIGLCALFVSMVVPFRTPEQKRNLTTTLSLLFGFAFLLLAIQDWVDPIYSHLLLMPLLASLLCYAILLANTSDNRLVANVIAILIAVLLVTAIAFLFPDINVAKIASFHLSRFFLVSFFIVVVLDTHTRFLERRDELLNQYRWHIINPFPEFPSIEQADDYFANNDDMPSSFLLPFISFFKWVIKSLTYLLNAIYAVALFTFGMIFNLTLLLIIIIQNVSLWLILSALLVAWNLIEFVPTLVNQYIVPALQGVFQYVYLPILSYCLASYGLYILFYSLAKYFVLGQLNEVFGILFGLLILILGLIGALAALLNKPMELVKQLLVEQLMRYLSIPFGLFLLASWTLNLISWLVGMGKLQSNFWVNLVGQELFLNPPGSLLFITTNILLITGVFVVKKYRNERSENVNQWLAPMLLLLMVGVWVSCVGPQYFGFYVTGFPPPPPTSTPIPTPTSTPTPWTTPTILASIPTPIVYPTLTGNPNTPSSNLHMVDAWLRPPKVTSIPTPIVYSTPTVGSNIPQMGDTWIRPTDGMVMVFVPGGSFQMGSDPDMDEENTQSNEQPQHEVTLTGFWIDRTEVNNAMYENCVADGECTESSYADNGNYNGANYPVVGVSWNDAHDYCEWAKGQLPTEAQWEYAARGDDGRLYPWGDETPTCNLAQLRGCDGDTVPVGSFPDGDSWVDAADMAGNVWEWVVDWYDDYSSAATTDPIGPASGTYKVLRGGSWDKPPFVLRVATRGVNLPDDRFDGIGFRCVVTNVTSLLISPTPTLVSIPTAMPTPPVSPIADPNIPPPNANLGDPWTRPADGMVMVYVPAGSFYMGSDPNVDEDAQSDELPKHEVILDAFWMDRTEVTNTMYTNCVTDGVCMTSYYADNNYLNGANYPVVGVSWYDANTYCEWAGGQLPTEAQWEYAARGVDERLYPWGNEIPTCNLAQIHGCGGNPAPVGNFSPTGDSWVGAADISGNVWEWVADWYDESYYESFPRNNPTGPEYGGHKVLRGGSRTHVSFSLRVADRFYNLPTIRLDGTSGFRCAVSSSN